MTLLVVRAATAAEAADLRAQMATALPAGTAVEMVRLPAGSARLLRPPA